MIMSAAQVDVHTNLGDLWRAQGPSGQAEAQRCYAEALRVDVRHAPAWRGLGDLMRERGEHTPAVACYQAGAWADHSAHLNIWRPAPNLSAVSEHACKHARDLQSKILEQAAPPGQASFEHQLPAWQSQHLHSGPMMYTHARIT